ncbi:PREDICTED: acyl-CoA Delta(11) desaturase-like [Dufourea novaeangliae]|uniref:acyl-CoA Delta(11) desaturase-like n=1 Tax=Dufourea novaeangliae TaxID=178035 RepID=UPI0007676577|nr:PREDICTED: acyl-CoA Delta(11) desaturase-like [Dufourea novaeangliae]
MAPNITSVPTGVLYEDDIVDKSTSSASSKPKYKMRIIWMNLMACCLLHSGAFYGLYLALTSAKLLTNIFAFWLHIVSAIGITGGAHRLWTHRGYKAKWPLQLLLMLMNTIAFQDAAINWAKVHRLHHKFSETDADPHNAKRGFFFSHAGWLLCRKHPDFVQRVQEIDMSDLKDNSILAFQRKYYRILMPLLCFVMPTAVPVLCWGETLTNAYFIAGILRYTFTMHVSGLVNSAAHLYGNKPYDRFMNPAENILVIILALGEGWHNYHHVFPWDYRTSEFDGSILNVTAAFINFFAMFGLAYDLKVVPKDVIRKRVERTGDGSHELWGWGDKDQTQEDRDQTVVTHRLKKDR